LKPVIEKFAKQQP